MSFITISLYVLLITISIILHYKLINCHSTTTQFVMISINISITLHYKLISFTISIMISDMLECTIHYHIQNIKLYCVAYFPHSVYHNFGYIIR